MKLKTSLFKKGLIISDIKRFWWISVLYALALFFVMPFNHYIQQINYHNSNNNSQWLKDSIVRELGFNGGSSQVFLLVVPIAIGALVFRYMQKSRSASLYHSMPLTRTALYFNSLLSGIILLTVPVFLNTIIMLLMNCFSSLSDIYSAALIFIWLGYTLLFGIMFLAMSVFVGMFTGSSIAQLAFVYILNLLPTFLSEFVRVNLRGILYGFDTYSNKNFYYDMPMFRMFNMSDYESSQVVITIVYIAVTIALLIGGLYAFKIRRPETAGDIITFRPIRPIFIYGFVSCATLFGGAYFLGIGNNTFSYAVWGYFISSIISYVVVQMVTNKSFKVLHTYKGYLGFALVLVILTLGIRFDAIGYINKIPNPSEVQETYIGYNIYWFENKDDPDFNKDNYNNSDTNVYKDIKNIENITKLHQYVLDNRSNNGNNQYIAYKLKNGKRIIRKYSIDTITHASVLAPIYESDEYKENRFPILYQEAENIKYIEINDRRAAKNPFIVSDKAQLEAFKTAIRKDIQKLTYQDLITNSQELVTITTFDTKDRNVTYALRADYTNTLEWLKKDGIYEQVIVKAEDVASITLQSMNYKYDYSYNSYGKTETIQSSPNNVEITDKAIIKEILDLSIDASYKDNASSYTVILKSSSNQHYFDYTMSFKDMVVSSELQSYLDKIKPLEK